LDKDAVIVELTGIRILKELAHGDCLYQLPSKLVIVIDSPAKFINHSKFPNSIFTTNGKQVFVQTLVPIERNEEITVNYGESYFMSNEITERNTKKT